MSETTKVILGLLLVLAGCAAGICAVILFFLHQFTANCWDGPQVGGCGQPGGITFIYPALACIGCVSALTLGYKLMRSGLDAKKAEYFRERAAAGWPDDP